MRSLLVILTFLTGCIGSLGPTYTIGHDPTWYPLSLSGKTNQVNAFVESLIQEMGEESHIHFKLIKTPSTQLLHNLHDGEYDAILSAIDPQGVNLETYDFSDPLLLLGPVLVVNEDSNITSLDGLNGKIIGTSQYGNGVMIAQKNPTLVIKTYENMAVALEDLAQGTIDAALVPQLEAEALVPSLYLHTLKIVSAPLDHEGIRLIALKGEQKELITNFNTALNRLMLKETYQQLLTHYQVN